MWGGGRGAVADEGRAGSRDSEDSRKDKERKRGGERKKEKG